MVRLQVNAGKQIATAKKESDGTNIEDLNNQTNGGVFSQLIHGEAFEENVDIDFLDLPVGDGEIELGFAFLQPGEWGRVNGLPVRKYNIDTLKEQGIKAIRYNGSMVDVDADTYKYRWKKMIGPVDGNFV